MQMSKAYEKLVELINCTDPRKAEWYSTGLLDKMYDSEVEKAEDLNQAASMRELRIILKDAPMDERKRMIEKLEKTIAVRKVMNI